MGGRDQRAATDHHRAHRGSQPLGEADRHGIEGRAQFQHGFARGHGGVAHARTIQMRGQAPAAGEGRRFKYVSGGKHLAADGVLKSQQTRARKVVVDRLDCSRDLVQRNRAVRGIFQRLRLDAAEYRGAAALELVGVGKLTHQVFVPPATMGHQGAQIRLRPGRKEQPRLFACPFRDHRLQPQHGGIVAPDIVADFGRQHRLAHARRRAGDGVAAQVDHAGACLACSRSCSARHCTLPVADFGSASMNSTIRGYL